MAGKNLGFTVRLLQSLKEKGISYEPGKKTGLKKFANDNGIVYTTLHKCVRKEFRGHVPEWDQLIKISEAFGKSVDWFLTGKEPFSKIVSPGLTIQETPKFKTYHKDFSLNNYIPVRLLKDAVAAGSPQEIDEFDVDGWALIYADKKWMPHDPENYTCCRIQGDSMASILMPGDIVAIDHADRDPQVLNKKIVAFRHNGGVTIKWLRLKPEGIYAIAENRDSTEPALFFNHEEMNDAIIGKVAWWWAKR